MDYRVGIGQDSHAFEDKKEKKLMIAGVELEGRGLKGNSDGDPVLHALCNALGSALGKGSLAPYSDKMCLEQGITDSKKYVEVPLGWMKEGGFVLENVSITIECKTPKIEPSRDKFVLSLSKLLDLSADRIGITATSGEGLSAFGKGEGVQVFVSVLLKKP